MESPSSWLSVGVVVLSIGAALYLFGGKKKRPTQHDLDPTLKKNQIRITTQKKAFRREDLPPEYLASIQRRDIVELPMGASRPEAPSQDLAPALAVSTNDWLPENLKHATTRKSNKKP